MLSLTDLGESFCQATVNQRHLPTKQTLLLSSKEYEKDVTDVTDKQNFS